MTLPSKELLSAVLGKNILTVRQNRRDKQWSIIHIVYTEEDEEHSRDINVYELMHLMKEWAFEQGVEVVTYKRAYKTYRALPRGLKGIQTPEITEATEFEVVTKACEWIKENNEK